MRYAKIDFLRFIGLSLIILAHVDSPIWLDQLRNFDVPLMVLTSGLAFTYSRQTKNYISYIWKRIKRLVFPVWLFLSFYFLVDYLGAKLGWFDPVTLNEMLRTYTFIGGIGYVWIIRVFIIVAIAAPWIHKANQNIKSNLLYLLILYIIFLGYEASLFLLLPDQELIFVKLLLLFVYYGIAYGLVFALGIRIAKLSKKQCLILLTTFLSIFITLAIVYYFQLGHIVVTQDFKYPPSAYYLSYAMAMTMLVWLTLDRFIQVIAPIKKLETVILLIAQNSLWIYLWHIMFLRFFDYNNFIVDYILVYSAAIIATYIQVLAVKNILLSFITKDSWRKNIKYLLMS
jgi:fucose 4-O-acetylase-like acetyltransferase